MTEGGSRRRGGFRAMPVVLAVLALGTGAGPVKAQVGAGASAPLRLTLEAALETALDNNRELAEAQLQLEISGQQVREAWSAVFPTLDLASSFTRNLEVPGTFLPGEMVGRPGELVPVRFGADNSWVFSLRAEQPLFRAAAFIGVGAAERYRALQEEIVRGQVQAVATRVRLAYYDVLLAEESARLNENAVERVRRALEETRAMHRAGVSSSYDVLRLEVELANLEPMVRRARNAVSAAKRALAVELGLDVDQDIEVVGSLAGLDLDNVDQNEPENRELLRFAGFAQPAESEGAREEILDQALASRSELRQLDLMEVLRETELKVERSEYLPTITLFGSYQITAQQDGSPAFFGNSASQRTYGRLVGVQVTMPLFAGFSRPARVQQRKLAVRQVEVQRQLAAAQVESQVRTLLDQVDEAAERAAAQRLATAQARRGYEIAGAQYREGLGSQLELTDAELALRQSEFNYAQAVYDYLVARAMLDEATGLVPVSGVGRTITIETMGARP
ncbi:MAG TPA: TolC family protein [Longimicrobiales bacterium]|nr:TolC family protein [Longimicrobiales bacterium]